MHHFFESFETLALSGLSTQLVLPRKADLLSSLGDYQIPSFWGRKGKVHYFVDRDLTNWPSHLGDPYKVSAELDEHSVRVQVKVPTTDDLYRTGWAKHCYLMALIVDGDEPQEIVTAFTVRHTLGPASSEHQPRAIGYRLIGPIPKWAVPEGEFEISKEGTLAAAVWLTEHLSKYPNLPGRGLLGQVLQEAAVEVTQVKVTGRPSALPKFLRHQDWFVRLNNPNKNRWGVFQVALHYWLEDPKNQQLKGADVRRAFLEQIGHPVPKLVSREDRVASARNAVSLTGDEGMMALLSIYPELKPA